MPLFLTILEGPTPTTARPFIATSDPDLIALVTRELMSRLTGDKRPAHLLDIGRSDKSQRSDPAQRQ